MAIALYGKKIGMTRVFDGDNAVPVTVIECTPNEVVEVKTAAKHGFDAIKVAVGRRKRTVSKAVAGEYKKADVAPREALREVPLPAGIEAKAGSKIGVQNLDAKKLVDVTGDTKGRGFAGVMVRWNFAGHKMTHGSMNHRGPGAIGCRMDPGRVRPGLKMAGHYGDEQVTIRNLKIVSIDAEANLVVVKGAIPGPRGALVRIRQA